MCINLDTIPQRGGQTDGRTVGQKWYRSRCRTLTGDKTHKKHMACTIRYLMYGFLLVCYSNFVRK